MEAPEGGHCALTAVSPMPRALSGDRNVLTKCINLSASLGSHVSPHFPFPTCVTLHVSTPQPFAVTPPRTFFPCSWLPQGVCLPCTSVELIGRKGQEVGRGSCQKGLYQKRAGRGTQGELEGKGPLEKEKEKSEGETLRDCPHQLQPQDTCI